MLIWVKRDLAVHLFSHYGMGNLAEKLDEKKQQSV
jgi:hypothetical protein